MQAVRTCWHASSTHFIDIQALRTLFTCELYALCWHANSMRFVGILAFLACKLYAFCKQEICWHPSFTHTVDMQAKRTLLTLYALCWQASFTDFVDMQALHFVSMQAFRNLLICNFYSHFVNMIGIQVVRVLQSQSNNEFEFCLTV